MLYVVLYNRRALRKHHHTQHHRALRVTFQDVMLRASRSSVNELNGGARSVFYMNDVGGAAAADMCFSGTEPRDVLLVLKNSN